MKNYTWILFDADDTLFHFDAYSGLKQMFLQYNVEFTVQDYEEYEIINRPLWVEYQNGRINAEALRTRRFTQWSEHLQCSPHDLNNAFINAMAEICTPIEGAKNLLTTLKNRVKLGIITNGFTELQQVRLERTGFQEYFEIIVVSEQVGFAKPHPLIFDHALTLMGNPSRDGILMVGDNPDSDILGGINAGFDTCWFNQHHQELPHGIKPHYEVASLHELKNLLSKTMNIKTQKSSLDAVVE
jgi:5'-nucleotidase